RLHRSILALPPPALPLATSPTPHLSPVQPPPVLVHHLPALVPPVSVSAAPAQLHPSAAVRSVAAKSLRHRTDIPIRHLTLPAIRQSSALQLQHSAAPLSPVQR